MTYEPHRPWEVCGTYETPPEMKEALERLAPLLIVRTKLPPTTTAPLGPSDPKDATP